MRGFMCALCFMLTDAFYICTTLFSFSMCLFLILAPLLLNLRVFCVYTQSIVVVVCFGTVHVSGGQIKRCLCFEYTIASAHMIFHHTISFTHTHRHTYNTNIHTHKYTRKRVRIHREKRSVFYVIL